MASKCPKCHRVLEEDLVCCAEVKHTWKCKSCGKLSTGFVVPYGRCYLCGGENELVQGYSGERADEVAIVKEAMQYELDMYQFYTIAKGRSLDPGLQAVLDEMAQRERDHLDELEDKYHVHLDAEVRELPAELRQVVGDWIFRGVDFTGDEHVVAVYDKAIAMEKRTRDHFQARAAASPPGRQREIYRELAAEEDEHVAMLETERRQIT